MKLFLLVFILIMTEMSCLKLPGKEDARIRKGLLGILSRFHQGLEPLALPKVPENIVGILKDSIINLPVNVLTLVASSFLEPKSLCKLSTANRDIIELIKFAVNYKLNSFCPHFVSDDHLVNIFINAVLIKHFPKSETKDSESFNDELQILTFKYAMKMLTFETVPKSIYFYVLAFLHEVAYGIDAIVPLDLIACISTSLRVSINRKLPKFWNFFRYSITYIPMKTMILSFHKNFIEADIETNPMAEELKKEFFKYSYIESVYADICIQRNIPFTPLNLIEKIANRAGWNTSLELFEKYLKSLATGQRIPSTSRLSASNSTFSRMVTSLRGKAGPFDYFLTRNSIDQFSMDEFKESNDKALDLLCMSMSITCLSLAHLDALAQVVRDGGLSTNDLSSVLGHFTNSMMVEVIFKEARVPLNIFYRNSTGTLVSVWNTIDDQFLDLFFEFLKSDDPLVFLTFPPRVLRHFSSKIRNKFNLDKRYSFDFTEQKLNVGLGTTIFSDLQGQVLSFKEIVNCTYLSAYKDCFTSKPEEFDDLSTVDMVNPPISINSHTFYNYF